MTKIDSERPMRHIAISSLAAAALLAGCNMDVKQSRDRDKGEKVEISSDLGNLKVNTEDVNPKDTGLSVFPNSTLKERTKKDEGRANVNIDTPWFGVKVVALTYTTDAPPDKVWDFYKKDMSQYGRPLECRPGSPDLSLEAKDDDDLVCYEKKDNRRNRHIRISSDENELKVGTDSRQRIVSMKPNGSGTEYTLVYVVTRSGREAS
jgi:hypothetical protein